MHDKPHRKPSKAFMVILISFGLVILACTRVCTWASQQEWIQVPPEETKVYTSYLPAAAKTIEGWADVPDLFGDFSMQVVFTLSDEELDKLLEIGFAWFPSNWEHPPSKPNWQTGPLPQDVLLYSFDKLENRPKDKVIYTYYDERNEQMYQLVIIDRERRLVYYARGSW